jgi:hypothetical protein
VKPPERVSDQQNKQNGKHYHKPHRKPNHLTAVAILDHKLEVSLGRLCIVSLYDVMPSADERPTLKTATFTFHFFHFISPFVSLL